MYSASLILHNPSAHPGLPVAFGVPMPRGVQQWTPERTAFVLQLDDGRRLATQARPLSHWSDGSVRWLKVDACLPPLPAGRMAVRLEPVDGPLQPAVEDPVQAGRTENARWYRSGSLGIRLIEGDPRVWLELFHPIDTTQQFPLRIQLESGDGRVLLPRIDQVSTESSGPIRSTFRLDAHFPAPLPLRLSLRLSLFAGLPVVQVEFRVHNPQRAEHPGGLWDLGDPGSLLLRDLSLIVELCEPHHLALSLEAGGEHLSARSRLSLFQASSGGENWQSRTHVNRENRVTLPFQGYQLRLDEEVHHGLRPTPTLHSWTQQSELSWMVEDFWERFPQVLEGDSKKLRVGIFPAEAGDLHELQGGEARSSRLWLGLAARLEPTKAGEAEKGSRKMAVARLVEALHRLPALMPTEAWSRQCGILPFLPKANSAQTHPDAEAFSQLLSETVDGSNPLEKRREQIDEYGWRHYGEIYADHENAYFKGQQPVISHYNNQYDFLRGLILNGLRREDPRFFALVTPLARHVLDIDRYQTREDKAAYNGGMFWHTDHYVDAATSTHRTYSIANKGDRSGYGGGPSSQHAFTQGLLLHHYLTGDETARQAVLELADWTLALDSGRDNFLNLLVDNPAGWATATFDFHGPGRGAGWSINSLLDALELSGDRIWLEHAERFIRRTIHPDDDIDGYDLLNAELRWSYTLYLSILARYLNVKREREEQDETYWLACAALARYGQWMLEHETPYFDRRETLEFPTETWAGQDLRKANVLRLASGCVGEPLRQRMWEKGARLASRAWQDLLGFKSRGVARSLAIVLNEGLQDEWLRETGEAPEHPVVSRSFPPRAQFISQRTAARSLPRQPTAVARAIRRLLSPGRWRRLLEQRPSIRP